MLLPREAVFCNACGERLDKTKDLTSLLQNEEDIASRYRITSLVRRRPYVTLYFALNNGHGGQEYSGQGQPRMVAIRDIDLTALDEAAFSRALQEAQREYDVLRRAQIPHIMPAVDLRHFQGHLSTVAALSSASNAGEQHLATLQDFLQSGQGLPSEQRVLQWMETLCAAVEGLHRNQVVIGDLDPYAILLSGDTSATGDARPALMISWLPGALQALLPATETTTLSYFIAPEAMQGAVDARADVYSLGAILYLLLTGMPPGDSTRRGRTRLRPPQEINSRISPHVSECVLQALAINPAERFQGAAALATALRTPRYRRPPAPARQEPDTAGDASADSETVRIIPLSRTDLERWRSARGKAVMQKPIPQRPVTPRPQLLDEDAQAVESDWELSRDPGFPLLPTTPPPSPMPLAQNGDNGDSGPSLAFPEQQEEASGKSEHAPDAPPPPLPPLPPTPAPDPSPAPVELLPAQRKERLAGSWKQRVQVVSGIFPALSPALRKEKQAKTAETRIVMDLESAQDSQLQVMVEASPADGARPAAAGHLGGGHYRNTTTRAA